MGIDMTVPCGEGLINIRVGAIILKDGKFLMAGNSRHPEYLYSVGGRVQFGETAEQAIVREVLEETGAKMEIDRLGFVHENYFICDTAPYLNKPVYEVSFYFYMNVPADFEPVCESCTAEGVREYLRWISPEDEIKCYPEFFKTELKSPVKEVKHFVNDDRN